MLVARFLNFKQLSLKQRILKFFRISYISHFYRNYIKANVVSFLYKYSFTRELFKRYQDYRYTKKRYKGLKNSIRFKVKLKKIVNAWSNNDYELFFKLSFLLIFAWPIWLFKKFNNAYLWLQLLIKSFFEGIKKLFNLIDVTYQRIIFKKKWKI